MLGVICEVTFKVEPRVVFKHEYEVIPLNPLPTLANVRGGADAVLGFMQPYSKQLLVERRFKDGNSAPSFWDHVRTKMRSVAWEHAATQLATIATSLPFEELWLRKLDLVTGLTFKDILSGLRASRADCMVDFAREPFDPFDFTFWAFPVSRWAEVVPAYLAFCEGHPFKASLFTEVYLISRDDKAALSFCPDGDVFTLDAVDHRPANAGWHQFNRDYNDLAMQFDGRPLLNQTKQLSRAVIQGTLGNRWDTFRQLVATEDSSGRFGNSFFDDL